MRRCGWLVLTLGLVALALWWLPPVEGVVLLTLLFLLVAFVAVEVVTG